MRLRHVAELGPPVPGLGRDGANREISFIPLDAVWSDDRFDPSQAIEFTGDVGSYNPVQEGDLIVPKVSPTFTHGRTAIAQGLIGGLGLATSEVFVVRPRDPTTARFLKYRLLATDFLTEGQHAWTGVAGLKRVSADFVRNVRISENSWRAHEAIADFLDRECERLRETGARAKELAARALEPVLADVEAEFDRYPKGRIGYRYEVQLGKKLYENRVQHRTAEPYLRNANVYWDRFELGDVKVMNFEGTERAKYELRPGDLLVCEARHLGRSAVWEGQITPCFFQMALNRVRPLGDDSTRWLMWCLRILNMRNAWAGDDVNIPHLPAEKLRATRVPLPSPDTQRSLVKRFDAAAVEARRLEDVAVRVDARLQEYKDGLITEAVTGKLDVTKVSDAQMDERLHEAMEDDDAEAAA